MKERRFPGWLIPLLGSAVLTQAALNLSRPLVTYRVIGWVATRSPSAW